MGCVNLKLITRTNRQNKMKKIFFLLFLIYTSQLFPQNSNDWNFVHHLPQNTLYSVKPIPGTSKIIAVGDAGTIMISPDMGATWNAQYIKQFQYLSINSIFFTDSVNGYIGGGTGFVYKTTDGGSTWSEQHTGTTAWVNAIYFSSLNVGYVACSNGIIVKTIDGGANWTTVNFPSTHSIKDIYFKNDSQGFVLADQGGIYYTYDGGNSWVPEVLFGSTQRAASIQAFNDSTIYVTGHDTLTFIYKTFNGGTTWNRTQATTGAYINKSCFTSLDTGFAIVGTTPKIARTTDGGLTWVFNWVTTGIWYQNLRSVDIINSNYIMSSLTNGMLLKSTDYGNSWIPLTDTIHSSQYKDCYFFNDSTGIILSEKTIYAGANYDTCRILRTTDGGLTYDSTLLCFGQEEGVVNTFRFANDSVGFVAMQCNIGTGIAYSSLATTRNRGLTWNTINHNLPTWFYMSDFQFLNDTLGYAVSQWGGIAKTIDGGYHWTAIHEPTYPNAWLTTVFFINDSVGFVGGATSTGVSPSLIAKTTDGGITWADTIFGSAIITKIKFVSDSIGFACDDYGGHIYKTLNQGQSWFLVATTGIGLLNMFFPSDSVGYCTGGFGRIVKTTDQGQTWGVQYSKSSLVLKGGSFINDSTGYLVGGTNSLIHIKGNSYVCPEATFSPSTLNANVGDTINFGFYFYYWQLNSQTTYTWNFGDGTYDSVPYASHSFASGGDYTVTFTVHYRDCVTSSSCIIHINSTVGLPNYFENEILIYPNPFNLQVTITFETEQKNTTILISDILGREIKSIKFTGKQMTIDRGEMKSGVYFVQITDEQKHISNRKIIIQ